MSEEKEKYIMSDEEKEDMQCLADIVSDYYPDYVSYKDGDEVIHFVVGMIIFEKGEYMIEADYTFVNEPYDIFSLMSIVREASDCDIELEVYSGFHSIFNEEDDTYIDLVHQSDIYQYSEENDVCEHEAFHILVNQLKEKNKKDWKVDATNVVKIH